VSSSYEKQFYVLTKSSQQGSPLFPEWRCEAELACLPRGGDLGDDWVIFRTCQDADSREFQLNIKTFHSS